MADDCITGLDTNEAAREALMARFEAMHTAAAPEISAIEVIYPNKKPPALEGRTGPFILLTLVPLLQEQSGMGEQAYITSKLLDISLWVRQYSGIKLVNGFLDFANSLGLTSVAGIAYGVPDPKPQKLYKGWEINPVFLPIIF